MDKTQWKNVLDKLDEDMVNSAAERFGKVRFSDENPEYCPQNSVPKEYRYSSDKGKSRRRLFVILGSAAAAVSAGVFITVGVTRSDVIIPLSARVKNQNSEVSSVIENPVNYVEKKHDDSEDLSDALKTGGFSALLFDDYFYGIWSDSEGDYTVNLGYSVDSIFGYGRTLSAMDKSSDGCYMLAQTDSCLEYWFVPENDRTTLYIYRNVTVENGLLQCGEDGEISCDYVTELHRTDSPDDEYGIGSILGYFGVERLAEEMGVTAEWLLNQVTTGYDPQLLTQGVYYDERDNVYLIEKSDDKVTLRMKYALAEDNSTQLFTDVTFVRTDGGVWTIQDMTSQSELNFRTAEQLQTGLTKDGLSLFKQYFTGIWSSTDGELPDITLIYDDDIFTPVEYCAGVAQAEEGWAMYQAVPDGMNVYYIPQNEPYRMYLFAVDENGCVSSGDFKAVYDKNQSVGCYGGSVMCSWLGLERYRFMHDENTDGDSLTSAIDKALEMQLDGEWSAANYTAGMEGWDGYRIAEQSDSLVLFSYQLFNASGESRWVTRELVKQGTSWTLGELTERVLTDDDLISEEGFVPITWSEAENESDGEYDGR